MAGYAITVQGDVDSSVDVETTLADVLEKVRTLLGGLPGTVARASIYHEAGATIDATSSAADVAAAVADAERRTATVGSTA